MNKKNKVLLLHIIDSNGNVQQLIHEGLSYKNISETLEVLVNEELVTYDNQEVKLTEKGKANSPLKSCIFFHLC